MLEQEISALREDVFNLATAIRALTDVIAELNATRAKALIATDSLPNHVSQNVLSPNEQSHQAYDAACEKVQAEPDAEPKKKVKPEPKPEPKPEVLDQKITREDIQSIALELVRADDSMKAKIKAILTERGVATITKLSDADLRGVHGELLALAHKIAKEGEVI